MITIKAVPAHIHARIAAALRLEQPSSRKRHSTGFVKYLDKAGVKDAAYKLAVFRCLSLVVDDLAVKAEPSSVATYLNSERFLDGYDTLRAVQAIVATGKTGRHVRERTAIAMAPFLACYHLDSQRVIRYYAALMSGKTSGLLAGLSHTTATVDVNSQASRRHYLVSSIEVIMGQLDADKETHIANA